MVFNRLGLLSKDLTYIFNLKWIYQAITLLRSICHIPGSRSPSLYQNWIFKFFRKSYCFSQYCTILYSDKQHTSVWISPYPYQYCPYLVMLISVELDIFIILISPSLMIRNVGIFSFREWVWVCLWKLVHSSTLLTFEWGNFVFNVRSSLYIPDIYYI